VALGKDGDGGILAAEVISALPRITGTRHRTIWPRRRNTRR
jgi:hypothetical protein